MMIFVEGMHHADKSCPSFSKTTKNGPYSSKQIEEDRIYMIVIATWYNGNVIDSKSNLFDKLEFEAGSWQ